LGALTDPLAEGIRALGREEVEPALGWLRQAVIDRPNDATVHAYLGCALLGAGDVAAGMEHTAIALRLDPEGFAANLKAGELDLRLGDPLAAEARFLAALRASSPGRDRDAARLLLSEARRRARAGIPHHATLPSWRPLGRRRRKDRTGRPMPGEAGGATA
jgi:tetratricopeptide (TPR) repeat protein